VSSGRDLRTRVNITGNQKGSVMLEFVFAISILIVIFLGSITFSLLFSDYFDVQKVARECAREAAITGDESRGVSKAYETAWLWGLNPERLSVALYRDSSGNSVTNTCVVLYTAKPFSRTFPTLVKHSPLDDIRLYSRAAFQQ